MDFERLRRNWENLGRADPMWAILTDEESKGGGWDEDAFFATGREFVEWLAAWLGRHRIDAPRGAALDFGCGIGRLTQALAPHFEHVTGVDVSAPMIDRAREVNRHGDRVDYVCNTRPDLSIFLDASFDFALTAIVLQHMRVDYQLAYLREFLRVLRPGGVLVFQVAVGELRPGAAPTAPAEEPPDEAHMEIHCLEPADVRAALRAAGGRILLEEPDRWAGEHWASAHYAVLRG